MAQPHREYILEVFTDQTFVKDIVKGIAPYSTSCETISSCTRPNQHCESRSPPHHILPPLFSLNPTLSLHTDRLRLSLALIIRSSSPYPPPRHPRPTRNRCCYRLPHSSTCVAADFTFTFQRPSRRLQRRDRNPVLRQKASKNRLHRRMAGPSRWGRADRRRGMLGGMDVASRSGQATK